MMPNSTILNSLGGWDPILPTYLSIHTHYYKHVHYHFHSGPAIPPHIIMQLIMVLIQLLQSQGGYCPPIFGPVGGFPPVDRCPIMPILSPIDSDTLDVNVSIDVMKSITDTQITRLSINRNANKRSLDTFVKIRGELEKLEYHVNMLRTGIATREQVNEAKSVISRIRSIITFTLFGFSFGRVIPSAMDEESRKVLSQIQKHLNKVERYVAKFDMQGIYPIETPRNFRAVPV